MADRHPNKKIQAALEYAAANGWRIVKSKRGHAWGQMLCGHADRGGCRMSIASTPRDPDGHAKVVRRRVDKCPHRGG